MKSTNTQIEPTENNSNDSSGKSLMAIIAICIIIIMGINNKYDSLPASHTKGTPIEISSLFGNQYVDIRIDCKNSNCGRERFYFSDKNIENDIQYAFRANAKIVIHYKGLYFNSIKNIELE